MRLARALAAVALTAGVLSPPGAARADLIDDARLLVERWSQKEGTSVERRPTLFVEHGHTTIVKLDGGAASPAKASCTTVVLLAPRTSEIILVQEAAAARPAPPLPPGHPPITAAENEPLRSKAGVLRLERCGKEQAAAPLEAERLLIESASPRAAVEVLVARSAAPIEGVESILPERAVGLVAPRGSAGRPLDPGPASERIARAEKRSRDDGAERTLRASMRASAAGTGEFDVRLSEGCHTLDVIGDVPPGARVGADVDAEAHVGEGGRLLARDRGEAPDARLDLCVGEPTEIEITFIGAAAGANVTLVDALWPLPRGIPSEWGPQARGDIASALRRRHAPPLPPEPIETVMGVQGETLVPFAVEPGQCYLAAVALVRGDARSMRLAVEIGDRAPHDELADRPEAAQVAFCATTEDRAALRVDVRGAQPWWVGLVWRFTP